MEQPLSGERWPFHLKPPQIPGYEPIRVLGINFCTVYLARHSSSGALVALKVCSLEGARHVPERSLAGLHHPNIIRVVGMGEFEGCFFCALEYGDNRTLADRVLEGLMSDVEVARIALAVCSALQYARDQGLTPRSLTPKSIVLTHENVPKLLDFCPTETFGEPRQMLMLPPAAMAPEWILGVGFASEAGQVYRMGVLLYEMLTARPPFAAADRVAALNRVLDELPDAPRKVRPNVGRALEAVCMKCLAKAPEARYASLQEVVDHLKPFVESRKRFRWIRFSTWRHLR